MFMDNRDQFLEMMNKAEQGAIDVIVVLRLDRLARDIADATMTIKLLNAYGCTLQVMISQIIIPPLASLCVVSYYAKTSITHELRQVA
jgi:DNA invertase Pin-like site-specific DNA recombinase